MDLFAQITKVDEARREVWGRTAQEIPDRSGEIMDYETSKPFFESWSEEINKATGGKSLGNVRSMHGNIAAGKVIALNFDDVQKAVDVGVKVVDDNEWEKVCEGVLSGFSIGGRYEKKWPDGELIRYTAAPSEISLVDRPCIPSATFFSIQKADGTTVKKDFKSQPEVKNMNKEEASRAVDQLAKMLDKGVVTPERLVELAMREGRRNPHFVTLEKGLSAVGNLAQLLNGLAVLQQACQWEAESEGDDSPVPAALMAAVKQLSDTLIAMASEETKEVINMLSPAAGDDSLAQMGKPGGLIKAGARNSAADLKHLQAAHDHLVACGASCSAKPNESAKADAGGGLVAELAMRIRKLEEQPHPAPRTLRAVDKEADTDAEVKKDDIQDTPGKHNPQAAQALIKRQLAERWGAR